jgi:hypothetical protein
MIVALSVGLATVLVGLGLIQVTPRIGQRLPHRSEGVRFGYLVPLGSAVVVAALGLAMALQGVGTLAAN